MDKETEWFYIVDSSEGRRQEGPVSGGDLEAFLSDGKLSTDTLVWRDGMADWERLGTVPDYLQPTREDSSPTSSESESTETSTLDSSEDSPKPNGPSDTVTIKETGNHSVQFSKSRNVLLIVTNEYHAGPLVLTKLDLLGFLTAMESATPVILPPHDEKSEPNLPGL